MRILDFKVAGQQLSANGDFEHIVRGSKGYLTCHFDFDHEWDGFTKIAAFESVNGESAAIVSGDGRCSVPDDVTDFSYFKVKIVGAFGKKQMTTNKLLICQEG